MTTTTTTGRAVWLAIEIRFDAEPIEGRLYEEGGDGAGRPFSGWMGLMAAIEAVGQAASPPREREESRR
jgi:hypothetical protein